MARKYFLLAALLFAQSDNVINIHRAIHRRRAHFRFTWLNWLSNQSGGLFAQISRRTACHAVCLPGQDYFQSSGEVVARRLSNDCFSGAAAFSAFFRTWTRTLLAFLVIKFRHRTFAACVSCILSSHHVYWLEWARCEPHTHTARRIGRCTLFTH